MTKTEREVQKFQRAYAMLERLRLEDEMVGCGRFQYANRRFLAVGKGAHLPDVIGMSRKQLESTWEYIVSNPNLFLPIVDALGMVTESGQLSLFDTVFEPKK